MGARRPGEGEGRLMPGPCLIAARTNGDTSSRAWDRVKVTTIADMEPRRVRALELLLAGRTSGEVAEALGISRQTVWRFRQEPAFKAALVARQSDRVEDMRAELEAAGLDAAEYLRKVADGRERGDAARMRAAEFILARALPATLETSAEDRVRDALAAAVGGVEAVDALVRRRAGEALGFGNGAPLPPADDGEHQPPRN